MWRLTIVPSAATEANPDSAVNAALLPGSLLLLPFALLLVACTTEAQRKSADSASVQREAAREMSRICALPEAQREAEREEVRRQSGMVIYCGQE